MDAQAFISLGGTGILAYIMWQFANRFLTAHQVQVDARIAALETRLSDCEKDRLRLHEQITQLFERNARVDAAREYQATLPMKPKEVIVTNPEPIPVKPV